MKKFKIIGVSLLLWFMAGCTTTIDGKSDPLRTPQGKKEAIHAYIDLALGYVKIGNTEQAKEPLLEALKIDSSDANANAALAYVFQRENEPASAEQYFKKALSSKPNDARILNNYGVFLFGQKRYDDANVQFLKASKDEFYSERSLVFENLGLIALQKNNKKQAIQYFQRALQLNSGRANTLYLLTNIYYGQGDYANAANYYNGFSSVVGRQQTPASLMLGIRIFTALNNREAVAKYAMQLEQSYPNSIEYKRYQAGKK